MKRRNRINLEIDVIGDMDNWQVDPARAVPPIPTPRHARRDRRKKGPEGQCLTCVVPAPYLRPWCLDHAALHDPHVAEVLEQTGPLEPAREVTRG